MAILPTSIDFTDKDFDSVNARLDSMIAQVFPTWTDRERSNFGNVLKEMFAFVLDVVLYYLDEQTKEAFFLEATQRKNLIAMGKALGYVPFGNRAAEADITFTLGAVPINDVIIPADTVILTNEVTNPVEFRLLSPVTIPASTDPPVGVGTARNSQERQKIVASNGLPFQSITLDNAPILELAVAVQASNGLYTKVDNFRASRSTDRHFLLSIDQNDKGKVQFGNGTAGEIPVGPIIVDYEIGGGVVGTVESNTIIRPQGSFQDTAANPVTVAATNLSAAAGGVDRQTNDSIKELAPASLRVGQSTIAREDYEIVALQNTAVVRALMLTSDQDPSIEENSGILYLVADAGAPTHAPTTPSQATKNEIALVFDTRASDGGRPKTVTFGLTVTDAQFLTLDFSIVLFLDSGTTETAVRTNVTNALNDHFAVVTSTGATNANVDFGFNLKDANGDPAGEIPISDLVKVVACASGVRKLGDALTEFTVNGQHQDIAIQLRQFPKVGTVTLINGDTGNALAGG